jgi:8-oxo-dGTP pyrophosphatase MutT (NUDIX family)
MPTAGLIYISERKLLLAFSKNKQAFYLPGGKVDKNETSATVLIREIKEELNVHLYENDLQFHSHITAPAFGEPEVIIMQQDCFICTKKIGPSAAKEIEKIGFFDHQTYLQQPVQVPGVLTVFKILQEQNLVD